MMRINLVPPQERGRSQARVDWLRMAYVIGAGLTVLLLFSTGFALRLIGIKEAELQAMEQSFLQVETTRAELSRVRRANSELQAEVDRLAALAPEGRSAALLQTMKDVAALVPADAWLAGYTFDGERQVSMDGYAGRAEDVTRLLQRLEALPYVDDVGLVSLRRMGDDSGGLRAFTIRLVMGGMGP